MRPNGPRRQASDVSLEPLLSFGVRCLSRSHLFPLDFAPECSPLRSDSDDRSVIGEHLAGILRVFGS